MSATHPNPDLDTAAWIARYGRQPGLNPKPVEPFPYQLRLWEDPSPQRILLKSRQVGATFALAMEAACIAHTTPGSTILLISRNLAAARNLLKYITRSLDHSWKAGLCPPPALRSKSDLEWPDLDSRILSLPATEHGARSYSATHVYLDEVAYLPWPDEIYQGAAPTTAAGGRITLVSTPHGRGNLFHRLWTEAQQPDAGWSPHRIHWSDRPGWDYEWAARERKKVTRSAWQEEYELSFEADETSVFLQTDLDAITRPSRSTPVPPFFAGLDLGRSHDRTVLTYLDAQMRLFAIHTYPSRSWTSQLDGIANFLERTPPQALAIDSTGVGDAVADSLAARIDLHKTELIRHPYTDASRTALHERLILAIESQSITLQPTRYTQELLTQLQQLTWQKTPRGRPRPDHPPGGSDDHVQSLALALHAAAAAKKPRQPYSYFLHVESRPLLRFHTSGASYYEKEEDWSPGMPPNLWRFAHHHKK